MNVQHEPRRHRFVVEREGEEAVLDYELRADGRVLHLIRTWVPPRFRGRGLGVHLVKAGLEHARSQGLQVTTSCWFVDEYLERSPEDQDLRAP